MSRHLYVMISRTDTGMGRIIRFFTGGAYNHVSLCMDDQLGQFVSFARYHQDVPLAGGWIKESPERLLSCGKALPVRIFKLDVSAADAEKLDNLFVSAGHVPLVYNSLGALLSLCHIPSSIPGAYTCLEFTGVILGKSFHSIQALGAALTPYEIYRGDLFDLLEGCGNHDDPYFHKRGLWKGTLDTVIHFKILLWRLLRLEKPQDPLLDNKFDILPKNIPQSSI